MKLSARNAYRNWHSIEQPHEPLDQHPARKQDYHDECKAIAVCIAILTVVMLTVMALNVRW